MNIEYECGSKDEVELKDALDQLVLTYPNVTVGSYSAVFNPRYRTRITFDGTSESAAEAALDDLSARVARFIVDVE